MDKGINQKLCRISLFLIWLVVLMPVYTADALVITFNPDRDIIVTDSSAIVNWTTDVPATGKVKYGVVAATEQVESAPPKMSHSAHLSGLASGMTFKYYIESSNATDTIRLPSEEGDFLEFTTEAAHDRTPPKAVTSLAAPTISKESITLVWEPDPRDTDIDHYAVYKSGTLLNSLVLEKTFTDTGLNMSTEYTYQVSAIDASGNEGPKTSVKATTRSESFQELLITEFKVEALGTNVYLTWKTNLPSHTRVRYGANPLLLDQKSETPEFVTDHNITLASLPENSNFTFMAESCDASANCGNTSAMMVQTATKVELLLALDGMDCNPETKAFANANRLDVNGKSSPGAEVTIYVNEVKQRSKRITDTGSFSFTGLDLGTGNAEKQIRVTASDKVAPDKACEERVLLDYFSPQVDFANETLNTTIVMDQNFVMKGNLTDDHKVTLYAYLQSVDDTVAPPAPGNVSDKAVAANSITVQWDKYGSDVTDLYKYLIYRTDVPAGPIAAVEPGVTEFVDVNVSTATTYTYQVSALDKAGNEGQKSSPFSITTLPNGTSAPPITSIVSPSPSLRLTKEYSTANTSIQFTESIGPLFEGKNTVLVKFIDAAGNTFEQTFEVVSDKEPPQILAPTAADLQSAYSPSFTSDILIKGQINKQSGQVWVWVNSEGEEPDFKIDVGENGTFDAEIELSTSVGAAIEAAFTGDVDAGETTGSGYTGISGTSRKGAQNKVVMVAVDSYGRRSQPVQGMVTYTPCGEGYYWTVKLTEGGNVINTRELLEGIAAYGFGFELEWIGGGDASKAKPQNVRITKATVGTNEAKKYDFDWMPADPIPLCKKANCTKGFVMINFAPQNPPGDTYIVREQNLSNHRKGECWPGIPLGCIHLLLEMQIDSDPAPLMADYGPTGPPVGMQGAQTQKQCIDIKIALDERIDPSVIPKGLLKAAVVAINATLDFIDMIETPLKYITQVTLGLCLLSFISKFIVDALKSYYCKWNSAIKELGQDGIGGTIRAVREIAQGSIEKIAGMDDGTDAGACSIEFDPNDDKTKAANDACKTCSSWIQKSKWISDKWHLFCDRVMCPSVPSLQHYIFQNWKGGRRSMWRPGQEAAAATPTGTCTAFSDNAATENNKIAGACKCGPEGTTCGPSTDASAKVCRNGQCVSVTKNCRVDASVRLAAGDLDSNGLCQCQDGVCIAGQTCDDEYIRCRGMTVDSNLANVGPLQGDEQCKAKGWECKCPTSKWSKTQCQSKPELCEVDLCKNPNFNDKRCCAPTADPNHGGQALAGAAIMSLVGESSSLPNMYRYHSSVPLITGFVTYCAKNVKLTSECSCGGDVTCGGMSGNYCMPTSEEGADFCYDESVIHPCGEATGDFCLCGTIMCTNGETCSNGACTTAQETSPTDQAADAATQAAAGATTPAATPPTDGSRSGSTQNPEYGQFIEYVQGNYKRSDIAAATSDCEFAEQGRIPIQEMYKFYKEESDKDESKCDKGHLPQAACCPFEYMDEWGWGMMFNNEVKTSYCLANPGVDECGTGQSIIKGVTGICQPQGTTPRGVPQVLNSIQWKMDYPLHHDKMVNQDVVYLIDLKEDGGANSIRRGYYSKDEVSTVSGTVEEATGRIEITTGSYFMPEDGSSEEMVTWFSTYNDADISQDRDKFKDGLILFGDDIKTKIQDDYIEPKSGTKQDLLDKLNEHPDYVGTPAEEWYRQISGLMGEPGRQYLAEPAGSFIQSLLTLCLSGILAWIRQLKMILIRLRECFQSILLTGDGSSGQCQALVSQYICDLINEAISCILHRFGGGANARVGMGGIGGVFASISDSSRGIMASSQERYGDNNLFSSQFNAENVLHDACVFMFTGEWPTDWSAIFESATTLPINSTAWVFPATRRWQAYDPNTGFTRYVYRIAYTVFAGSSIHYTLKLKCSGMGTQCEDAEGNIGNCDCGYDMLSSYITRGRQTEMLIPYHQSGDCPDSGDLQQGQSCTDEVLFVSPSFLPLRYDQVALEWMPTSAMGQQPYGGGNTQGFAGTMASPQSVTGGTTTTIREIGGPPPGLCSFNLGQLAFRCGIEVPPLGYARFISTDIVRPPEQPYGLGDSVIVRARIEQALPPDAASCTSQCDFTKYLVVSVYNGQPGSAARIYPPYGKPEVGERLNENKLHDFNVFSPSQFIQHELISGGPFVITREHFTMQAMGQSSVRIAEATNPIMKGFVMPPVPIEGTQPSTLYITFQDGKALVQDAVKNQQSQKYDPVGTPDNCESPPPPGPLDERLNPEVTCGGIRFTLNAKNMIRYLRGKNLPFDNIPDFYVVLDYSAPTTAGTATTCSEDPVTWNMVLELRDTDSIGGGAGYQMSSGPTMDPETGESQKKIVPFKVACKESAASRGPEAGSISDLTMITAHVQDGNDANNKTFGLWTDTNSLGPGGDITIGDFMWTNPGPPPKKAEGFSLNIFSSVDYAILYIDVGRVGLIPSDLLTIKAGEQILMRCGEAPCIEDTGDTNNRVIKLRLTKGTPYTFSGFDVAEGVEGMDFSQGVTLTPANPAPSPGAMKLHTPMPSPELTKVTLTNYVQNDDSFTITYSTDPTDFFEPVTIGFDLAGMGYSASSVSIEGLDVCSGAAAAGGGGSTNPPGAPSRTGTVTMTGPILSGGSGTAYAFYTSSDGKTIWVNSANQPITGTVQVTQGFRPDAMTNVEKCFSIQAGAPPDPLVSILCPTGTGAAVTDIHSESSSLPIIRSSVPSVSLITGHAVEDVSGYVGKIYTSASAAGKDVRLTTPGYLWLTKPGDEPAANVIIKSTGSSEPGIWFATIANGHIFECNCPSYAEAKKLKDGKSSECTQRGGCSTQGGACTTLCKAGAAATGGGSTTPSTGGGTTPTTGGTTPGSTGATASPGAGPAITGSITTGRACYAYQNGVVAIKSMGEATRTITVTGLIRQETREIANLKDCTEGNDDCTIVLTAAEPAKYGLRASFLIGDGKMIISNIAIQATSITMDIEVQNDGPTQLRIELLPMKLKAQTSTQIMVAGSPTPLIDCTGPDEMNFENCILRRDIDRIGLAPHVVGKKSYRITGLLQTDNPCALIEAGQPCPSGGGTCIETPIEDIGKQCFSDCRKQYLNAHYDEIAADVTKLPAESKFCINTGSTLCRDADNKNTIQASTLPEGGCASGNKCCPTGVTKAKPTGGNGKGPGLQVTGNIEMGGKWYKCPNYPCTDVTPFNPYELLGFTYSDSESGQTKVLPGYEGASMSLKANIEKCCSFWWQCFDSTCTGPLIILVRPAFTYQIGQLNDKLSMQVYSQTVGSAGGLGAVCSYADNAYGNCVPESVSVNGCFEGTIKFNVDICGPSRVCCEPKNTQLNAAEGQECAQGAKCTKAADCPLGATVATPAQLTPGQMSGFLKCQDPGLVNELVCCKNPEGAGGECRKDPFYAMCDANCPQDRKVTPAFATKCAGDIPCCKQSYDCTNCGTNPDYTEKVCPGFVFNGDSDPCPDSKVCIRGITKNADTCVDTSTSTFFNEYCKYMKYPNACTSYGGAVLEENCGDRLKGTSEALTSGSDKNFWKAVRCGPPPGIEGPFALDILGVKYCKGSLYAEARCPGVAHEKKDCAPSGLPVGNSVIPGNGGSCMEFGSTEWWTNFCGRFFSSSTGQKQWQILDKFCQVNSNPKSTGMTSHPEITIYDICDKCGKQNLCTNRESVCQSVATIKQNLARDAAFNVVAKAVELWNSIF
jgi:hypothetical protein